MDIEAKKPDRNWKESIQTIIEMGNFLERMKGNFSRSDLAKMVRIDFNIDASTVDKVIKISGHPIISNPDNWDKLPKGWGTLYELRFLPDELIAAKLKAGELRTISKYDIWKLRGIKVRGGYEHVKGTGTNDGNRVMIPDGETLVGYVRAGMADLPEVIEGKIIDDTAKKLKIGVQTFRMVRGMIILSERPELTDGDRKMVLGLLEKINKTRNVREYYQQVKPLMDGIWGPGRNKTLTDKSSQKRVEIFRNAIVILRDTSDRILEMSQPYMSVEDIDKSINDLTEIRKNVGKLAENLRRSKND